MENDLITQALVGNRLAIGRLITQIENNIPQALEAMDRIFPLSGKAHLIGITGPTGSGKSTLVNRIAQGYRHPSEDKIAYKVGIVTVDPSSPFSGGSILGDRIRMRDLAGDPNIFIRSMSSRGTLGGLSLSTATVVQLLDACGFEKIIIETVGTGQSEVDIAELSHTVIVVQSPKMGDDIQAMKAGILEIADILVINKADLPGTEQTDNYLRSIFSFTKEQQDNIPMWRVPVIRTSAIRGEGINELLQLIDNHWEHLKQTDELAKREQEHLKKHMDHLLSVELIKRWHDCNPKEKYNHVLEQLFLRNISPHQAVGKLLE